MTPCPPDSRAAAIRFLNDMLRANMGPALAPIFGYGRWVMTAGLQAQGEAFVSAAIVAVRDFDGFTSDNDPSGTHDRGTVRVNGVAVHWAIDAYDLELAYASPDPADPAQTRRVLTLMLAHEA
jgi:hypothetical protein